MTQSAWSRDGRPVDAATFPYAEWETLKQQTKLGDFILPCCQAPAVLKTSINGFPFFAHLSDECATAPETIWHSDGKAAVMSALAGLGVEGHSEVPGQSTSGQKWQADVLFSFESRTIAVELQRSYQHLRDYIRRQERYAKSNVECYWLTRQEQFGTLTSATSRLLLKRDYGNMFPTSGIGTGCIAELPVSILAFGANKPVQFGLGKAATIRDWLAGVLDKTYRYREGSWYIH